MQKEEKGTYRQSESDVVPQLPRAPALKGENEGEEGEVEPDVRPLCMYVCMYVCSNLALQEPKSVSVLRPRLYDTHTHYTLYSFGVCSAHADASV